jgi:hypothetical protein
MLDFSEMSLFFCRIPVTITVRPYRVNIQNFYIVYEEVSNPLDLDSFVGTTEMNNDMFSQHLVDFMFIGDHALFTVRLTN